MTGREGIKFRSPGEIRATPLADVQKIHVPIDGDTLARLKSLADFEGTTVNEILRVAAVDLLDAYWEAFSKRIFYRVHYGVTTDGDHSSDVGHRGTLYIDIGSAEKEASRIFGQLKEMLCRQYSSSARRKLRAVAYVRPVTGITEDDDSGKDAWDLLDNDTKKRINAASYEVDGKDLK